MDQDLAELEQRVDALIALATELRTANRALRQEVVSLENENRRLGERIATAATRIEALLRKLPVTAE